MNYPIKRNVTFMQDYSTRSTVADQVLRRVLTFLQVNIAESTNTTPNRPCATMTVIATPRGIVLTRKVSRTAIAAREIPKRVQFSQGDCLGGSLSNQGRIMWRSLFLTTRPGMINGKSGREGVDFEFVDNNPPRRIICICIPYIYIYQSHVSVIKEMPSRR